MRCCSHRPFQAQRTKTGVNWPSFLGSGHFVGTSQSGRVKVYVDPALGAPALQNAQDLLRNADAIVQANDAIFGTVGGPVNVIVFAIGGATDGTGGADHMGCDYQTGADIEVCASYGNSARCGALFEAELSECSMNGQLCGLSTGEALSRWCAAKIGNNALADFASAPTWEQDGRPDFVNTVDQTDQNPDSIGCGMVFISWLIHLDLTLPEVAQAMVKLGDTGSLAQLYEALTGKPAAEAWPTFLGAVQGLPGGIQSDDPFAAVAPAPAPGPTPPPGQTLRILLNGAQVVNVPLSTVANLVLAIS